MDEDGNPRSSRLRLPFRIFLLAIGLAVAVTGCGGDDPPPELPFLEIEDDVQVEMFEVEYIFTDSAILKARLQAGIVREKQPGGGLERYNILSNGVRIDLYDNYGRTSGTIQSDSAIFYTHSKQAYLYNHVRLRSKKGEQMESDSLVWSQEKDSIFTEAPVHILTQAQEIFARGGLKAKADFSSYELYGTSGEVEIDEE